VKKQGGRKKRREEEKKKRKKETKGPAGPLHSQIAHPRALV
jgi:hypothetical protein